ncbi:hypothetical protein BT96DRAFT_778963, partial [Gymnopus androsaceus JB14]
EGGKRIDHRKRSKFEQYAVECAQSWFTHSNDLLAYNGTLYLVTGFDKARAWGVASIIDVNQKSVSLEFVPQAPSTIGGPPRYWFRSHNSASASSDGDDVYRNQSGCVFLCGIKIAVR